MKNSFKHTLATIEKSLDSMDEAIFSQLLEDCQKTIEQGNKVIASGLGKNAPVCDKFAGTMNSLGIPACFIHTDTAVHGDLGLVRAGDLVILLTKSGETGESISLAKSLQQREVNLWLLTFRRESTLTREIQKSLVLDLEHEGDAWNIVPSNSTTVNLIVLQELALRLAERLGVTLHDFQRNHPGGGIGEQLKHV